MIEDILQLGNKIEMQEIVRNPQLVSEDIRRTYVSQILEFDDEDEEILNIAMPIYEGRLIPLEVGKRFALYFYAHKGLYKAAGEIINRYKSNNVYILVIQLLTGLKKYQRRQFFRYECNIEFEYKAFNKSDEKYFRVVGKISEEMEARPFEKGISIDLSGGGIKFITKDKLESGTKVIAKLDLLNGSERKICQPVARVLSCNSVRGKAGVYECRIEFIKIEEEEREYIIKFIFEEERKQRKKLLE